MSKNQKFLLEEDGLKKLRPFGFKAGIINVNRQS